MRRGADLTDALTIAALSLFLVTCATSKFPRFSFDSAMDVVACVGAYGIARRALGDEENRRRLIVVLAACGAFFVIGFGYAWGSQWLQWMSLTAKIPPLDLDLTNLALYAYRYPVAIVIATLVPILLATRVLGMPRIAIALGIVASAALVVMSGSRSAWLGLFLGLLSFLVARRRALRRISRRTAAIGSLFWLALIAALGISGVIGALVTRALTLSSVSLRFEIWSRALQQFGERPLLGSGPGTFPTMLTLSGFYRSFPQIGEGPDSAPIQVLSESGLLGFAALAIAMTAVVIAARRNPNRWTPYALASTIIVAGSALTNDSVHVHYLVAVGIVAAALAGPTARTDAHVATHSWSSSGRWLAIYAGAAVVMGAVSATQVGLLLRERGVDAALHGDQPTARGMLSTAVSIDPSNGLLQRDLGLVDFQTGEADQPYRALSRAIFTSPADVAAMRGAALAAMTLGRPEAIQLARRAAALRPLDPMNLEVLALIAGRNGDYDQESQALVELLRHAPYLPAALSWQTQFPTGTELATLLWKAAKGVSSASAEPSAESEWLFAAAGLHRDDLDPALVAIGALLDCDRVQASAALATSRARQNPETWDIIAQVMVARALGDDDAARHAANLRVLLYTPVGLQAFGTVGPGSPVNDPLENWRIYRLIGPGVPAPEGVGLPTFEESINRWMNDPVGSARRAAPESALATCNL